MSRHNNSLGSSSLGGDFDVVTGPPAPIRRQIADGAGTPASAPATLTAPATAEAKPEAAGRSDKPAS